MSKAVALVGVVWGFVWLINRKLGKRLVIERSYNGRQLGLLERWYTAHESRGDRNICYIMRMQGKPPSLDLLTECMIDITSKHNGMHCETVPSSDSSIESSQILWQTICPPTCHSTHPWAPLIVSISRKGEETASELVQQLVNQNFEANFPPWRIHLISDAPNDSTDSCFEIVLSVNHLIADGISGMIICREILNKLCELCDPSKNFKYTIQKDPFFALEEKLDTRPRILPVILKLFETYVVQRISIKKWKKQAFVPVGSDVQCLYTGKAETGSLTEDTTGKLIARCKEERTSVHAIICVAAHIALAQFEDNLYPSDNRTEWTQILATPTNLRGYAETKIQGNALGVFISRISHTRTVYLRSNVWDLARRIQCEVKKDLFSGVPLLGMLRYVPSLIKLLDMEFQKYPAGRDTTICLSNLGNQPIHLPYIYEDGSVVPLKLRGIEFTQQHHLGSGSSFMASIVTCADKLHISICSAQPVIPVEWNKTILSSILQTLELLANSSETSTISDIKCTL